MKRGPRRWKDSSVSCLFWKWQDELLRVWIGHTQSQQEHCLTRKLTSWCSSNIHLLPRVEASINHKSVPQSHYTVVPLATTRSPSFRRQSIKDRFARPNWIFHIQDCLLHLIKKEIFKQTLISRMSKPFSRACKIVQSDGVPLLGHISACTSSSLWGLQNCNDLEHFLFIFVPLGSSILLFF